MPGVYNPRNSHYVSIEEHGIAVEKISCKQEPISEESEVLPLSNPPSLEELPIPTDKPRTEDKATQYDLKPSQKVNQSALYAELLETTEAKIDIMLKLYKSYDKILEKFEHRLNKKWKFTEKILIKIVSLHLQTVLKMHESAVRVCAWENHNYL